MSLQLTRQPQRPLWRFASSSDILALNPARSEGRQLSLFLGDFTVGDDRIYNVNDVIASLDRLHGQTVRIACVLCVEFEGDSIWHTPKAERLPGYGSSLWADFDREAVGGGLQQLAQFDGRHVVVTATVDNEMQGHFSLWPGSVLITSIIRGKG
jgi:hypothetical protein